MPSAASRTRYMPAVQFQDDDRPKAYTTCDGPYAKWRLEALHAAQAGPHRTAAPKPLDAINRHAGSRDDPGGAMLTNRDWERLSLWWVTPVAKGGSGCWIDPDTITLYVLPGPPWDTPMVSLVDTPWFHVLPLPKSKRERRHSLDDNAGNRLSLLAFRKIVRAGATLERRDDGTTSTA